MLFFSIVHQMLLFWIIFFSRALCAPTWEAIARFSEESTPPPPRPFSLSTLPYQWARFLPGGRFWISGHSSIRDKVPSNDGFQSLSMPVTITGIVGTDLYPLAIVHILFPDWKKRTFATSRGRIRIPTWTGNPFHSGPSDSLLLIRDVWNTSSRSSGHDRDSL